MAAIFNLTPDGKIVSVALYYELPLADLPVMLRQRFERLAKPEPQQSNRVRLPRLVEHLCTEQPLPARGSQFFDLALGVDALLRIEAAIRTAHTMEPRHAATSE